MNKVGDPFCAINDIPEIVVTECNRDQKKKDLEKQGSILKKIKATPNEGDTWKLQSKAESGSASESLLSGKLDVLKML